MNNIRIVLDHTSHPGNIGATARAMKVMGLSALHLVAPRKFPHAESDALAVGAKDLLHAAQVHATLDAALSGCVLAVGLSARSRELPHEILTPRLAAQRLLDIAATRPVAVVFGNETAGLSNEELRKCQFQAVIPTEPGFSSLNVAAAVQIMCYELRCALGSGKDAPVARTLAPLADIERLHARLEQVLTQIDYFDPAHPGILLPRLRRLFARAQLEQEEFNILMGILKQVARATKVD